MPSEDFRRGATQNFWDSTNEKIYTIFFHRLRTVSFQLKGSYHILAKNWLNQRCVDRRVVLMQTRIFAAPHFGTFAIIFELCKIVDTIMRRLQQIRDS